MMQSMNPAKQRNLLLWIAFAAPAAGWFVQLCASYTIAAYACANDQMWILHSISAVAAALALAGIICGWKCRKLQDAGGEGTHRESGFLINGILLLAAAFLLTILVSEVGNWILKPCI